MSTAEVAKTNMIAQQIRPWEVLDHQVLSVMEQLNREDFVAEAYKGLAYADCQIPVAEGVRMLPPTIEGRMLQALTIRSDDEVLQLGSGSGYLTACLASLARQVTSVDSRATILELARENIANCNLDNVSFENQAMSTFHRAETFDVIAVTGSLPAIPDNLRQALRIGGRLFVIVGESPVMQALLITRVGPSEWTTQSLFETDLPRLGG